MAEQVDVVDRRASPDSGGLDDIGGKAVPASFGRSRYCSGRSAIRDLVADSVPSSASASGALPVAEATVLRAERAVAFDQRSRELVGGAGEIGDEQ